MRLDPVILWWLINTSRLGDQGFEILYCWSQFVRHMSDRKYPVWWVPLGGHQMILGLQPGSMRRLQSHNDRSNGNKRPFICFITALSFWKWKSLSYLLGQLCDSPLCFLLAVGFSLSTQFKWPLYSFRSVILTIVQTLKLGFSYFKLVQRTASYRFYLPGQGLNPRSTFSHPRTLAYLTQGLLHSPYSRSTFLLRGLESYPS